MNIPMLAQAAAFLVTHICLSIGFQDIGVWQPPAATFGLLLVWMGFRKKQPTKANGFVLVGLLGIAAVGIGLGAPPLLMAMAGLGSLICWDLAEVRLLVQNGMPSKSSEAFMRTHFSALAVVSSITLIATFLAVVAHLELSLAGTVLLAMLLVASMSVSVRTIAALER